jgi:predicted secreted Zn-dependent protease
MNLVSPSGSLSVQSLFRVTKRMRAMITVTLLLLISGAAPGAENTQNFNSTGTNPSEFPRIKVLRPLINERVEFYEISGECEADLRNGMKDKGCAWKDGKKYHSLTSWSLKWDYDYIRTPQTCTVRSFQPVIDISTRYPKWAMTGNPPTELRGKWDRFMASLITHEEGHRDMVVEAVSEVEFSVMRILPQVTCADLDREISKICRSRMQQLDEDSIAYDAETKHGLKQGAVFP